MLLEIRFDQTAALSARCNPHLFVLAARAALPGSAVPSEAEDPEPFLWNRRVERNNRSYRIDFFLRTYTRATELERVSYVMRYLALQRAIDGEGGAALGSGMVSHADDGSILDYAAPLLFAAAECEMAAVDGIFTFDPVQLRATAVRLATAPPVAEKAAFMNDRTYHAMLTDAVNPYLFAHAFAAATEAWGSTDAVTEEGVFDTRYPDDAPQNRALAALSRAVRAELGGNFEVALPYAARFIALRTAVGNNLDHWSLQPHLGFHADGSFAGFKGSLLIAAGTVPLYYECDAQGDSLWLDPAELVVAADAVLGEQELRERGTVVLQ